MLAMVDPEDAMLHTFRACAAVAMLSLVACGGKIDRSSASIADGGPGDDVSSSAAVDAAETADAANTADASSSQGRAAYFMFLAAMKAYPSCLPQTLAVDAEGRVACTLFVVLPPGSACSAQSGLFAAPSTATDAVLGNLGAAPSSVVCVLEQLADDQRVNASCTASRAPGWCYVAGAAAGHCPQAITVSPGLPPPGAEALFGCE